MMEEISVEFRLVNDSELPPIVITMGNDDMPKVVLNAAHTIWLSLHRKTVGGCAESLFGKIDELLNGHLREQRAFQQMDDGNYE